MTNYIIKSHCFIFMMQKTFGKSLMLVEIFKYIEESDENYSYRSIDHSSLGEKSVKIVMEWLQ